MKALTERRRPRLAVAIAVLATVMAGAGRAQDRASCTTLNPVPADLTVQTHDGRAVRLLNMGTRAVLVHVWSTFDPVAQSQVPALVGLDAKFRSRGLAVVGLSGDDSIETLRKYAEDHGITYQLAMPSTDARLRRVFGAKGIGHLTFLLPDGRVCGQYAPGEPMDRTEADIAAQLGEAVRR